MNFEQAKAVAEQARSVSNVFSAQLNAFPRSEMGLITDEVKRTDAFKLAYKGYQMAFSKERDANAYLVKNFKKEIQAERAKRFATV